VAEGKVADNWTVGIGIAGLGNSGLGGFPIHPIGPMPLHLNAKWQLISLSKWTKCSGSQNLSIQSYMYFPWPHPPCGLIYMASIFMALRMLQECAPLVYGGQLSWRFSLA